MLGFDDEDSAVVVVALPTVLRQGGDALLAKLLSPL